jgi:hypothetical protein
VTHRRVLHTETVNRVRPRGYWCDVMAERVTIRLAWRFGHTGRGAHIVQCDQVDCQYAGTNAPPCPLSVALFLDELSLVSEPDVDSRGSAEHRAVPPPSGMRQR